MFPSRRWLRASAAHQLDKPEWLFSCFLSFFRDVNGCCCSFCGPCDETLCRDPHELNIWSNESEGEGGKAWVLSLLSFLFLARCPGFVHSQQLREGICERGTMVVVRGLMMNRRSERSQLSFKEGEGERVCAWEGKERKCVCVCVCAR